MKVTLPVATLREAIEPVAALTNEALLIRRENELVVTGLTPDRTANITVMIGIDDDNWNPSHETEVGVKLVPLTPISKVLSTSTEVTVTGSSETDWITVTTDTMQYWTGPLDKSSVRHRDAAESTPTQRVEAVFPSGSTPLDRSLRAADLCGDTLTIETGPEDPAVRFSAAGDLDSMECSVEQSHLDAYTAGVCCVSYDLQFLLGFYRTVKSSADHFSLAIDATSTLVFTTPHDERPITTELRLSSLDDTNQSAE